MDHFDLEQSSFEFIKERTEYIQTDADLKANLNCIQDIKQMLKPDNERDLSQVEQTKYLRAKRIQNLPKTKYSPLNEANYKKLNARLKQLQHQY